MNRSLLTLAAAIMFFASLPPSTILFPVRAENVSYVPGNAEWLGDYGSGEDIPDVASYLPYSYVVFGSGQEVIPRLLVDTDVDCPQVVAELESLELPIPVSITRAVGTTSLPYAFPIRVCEVRITVDSHKDAWSAGILHWEGVNFTTPIPTNPTRFLLIGDTGLRVKPNDLGLGKCDAAEYMLYEIAQCERNFTQADLIPGDVKGDFQSTDESSWPLRALQTFAAQEGADVIVYVGDYLYRQGPCPEGSNVSCVNINVPPKFELSDLEENSVVANFLPGTWGDNLFGWWADLFWPALELFKTTPVIAIRGNHEICERAGHGYFLFFDVHEYPNDTVAGQYCLNFTSPRPVSFANEQFLVFDDSFINPLNGGIDDYNFTEGACPEAPEGNDPPLYAIQTPRFDDPTQNPADIQLEIDLYSAMMQVVRNLSLSHDTNFYVSHRPAFAVACNGSTFQSSDWTIQQSLGPNTFNRVSACIGGHMHWLLALAYDSLPHQIVVGHGGTKIIPNYVNQDSLPGLIVKAGKDDMFRGVVTRGMSSSAMHGYGIMERNDEGNYLVWFRGLNGTRMVDLNFSFVIPKGPRVSAVSPTSPPADYPTATAPPTSDTSPSAPAPTQTSDGTVPLTVHLLVLLLPIAWFR